MHLFVDIYVVKDARNQIGIDEHVTSNHDGDTRHPLDRVWPVDRRPDTEHTKHDVTLLDDVFRVRLVMLIEDHPDDYMNTRLFYEPERYVFV